MEFYPADFRYPRLPLWRDDRRYWSAVRYRGPRIEYWRRKWPARECKTLFDRCQGHRDAIQFDPKSQEVKDHWREKRGLQPITSGGEAIILGSPAKRHANLESTRADYNAQWGSYTNNIRLSRTLTQLRSLNIPLQIIEARNNMVANLERDFGRTDQTKAA